MTTPLHTNLRGCNRPRRAAKPANRRRIKAVEAAFKASTARLVAVYEAMQAAGMTNLDGS